MLVQASALTLWRPVALTLLAPALRWMPGLLISVRPVLVPRAWPPMPGLVRPVLLMPVWRPRAERWRLILALRPGLVTSVAGLVGRTQEQPAWRRLQGGLLRVFQGRRGLGGLAERVRHRGQGAPPGG